MGWGNRDAKRGHYRCRTAQFPFGRHGADRNPLDESVGEGRQEGRRTLRFLERAAGINDW